MSGVYIITSILEKNWHGLQIGMEKYLGCSCNQRPIIRFLYFSLEVYILHWFTVRNNIIVHIKYSLSSFSTSLK